MAGGSKWSKARHKDRVNHCVLFEEESQLAEAKQYVSKTRLVTISALSEKMKCSGALSRRIINMMADEGVIVPISRANMQWIYKQTPVEEPEVEAEAEAEPEVVAEVIEE
eukprot:gnl/Dysnectes_brevis/34_a41_18582.p2 GENE.gnl/Dysnectes_brevis/34_a41_18582~~gnl/Dysnectes_brevis/34_a41_18582.p2  ORF type:complete len:110 (-),score=32.49 gnl/Dysnectes_brevis/34_a41_18582:80-409(-)